MTPNQLKGLLFNSLEEPVGFGMPDDDQCHDWEEILRDAENAAYWLQVAANKARGVLRQTIKAYNKQKGKEKEVLGDGDGTE